MTTSSWPEPRWPRSSTSMAEDPGTAVVRRLVGFGRFLRRSGLAVGPGRVLTFCRAAAALDAFDRGDVRLAARATLVSRPEDFLLLDEAFERYFRLGILTPAP